jgi:hypothetical protein
MIDTSTDSYEQNGMVCCSYMIVWTALQNSVNETSINSNDTNGKTKIKNGQLVITIITSNLFGFYFINTSNALVISTNNQIMSAETDEQLLPN